MNVRWMGTAEMLAAKRDSVVVCLVSDAQGPGSRPATMGPALATVRAQTPAEVPLLILTCAGDRPEVPGGDQAPELLGVQIPGATLAQLVRRAAEVSAEADLVLLDPSCRVPPGWLARLRDAAHSDPSVASATPLGSDGGTVGVPTQDGVQADRLIGAVSRQARPRLLIGGPHCVYLCRSALELIGGVDGEQQTLGGLTAELCERFVAAGMLNVLADDVYVESAADLDAGGEPLGESPGGPLAELDRSDERSGLQRALQLARVTLNGLSVTIDARALGPSPSGTQLYTLELVLALSRFTDARVRAVIGPDIGAQAEAALRQANRVEVITYEQAVAGVELTDVVHRPQQVFSEGDMNLLRLLGRRMIVSHQDLIAYHNPTYHETSDAWKQYRRITRIALAAADRVVFFSEHSRRDAQAEDLIDSQRADVVGAAPRSLASLAPPVAAEEPSPPPGAPVGEDFILCLGPDYQHKNRRFAIALAGALRASQGWRGRLVLAGAHVLHGSSRPEEQQLLAEDPALQEAVVELGSVDDAGRAWLFGHATAVLVPSVLEGFGLVPLEAAQAGLPCLFAPVSSLVEVVDASLATLVPWDPVASAARVIALLSETPERSEHVKRLRDSARRWTWERLAGQLIGCYEQSLCMPFRAAGVRAWQELERERYIVELDEERKRLARLPEDLGDRIALASDDGFLTASQQQGLLRVGSRPALARWVLWPFGLLGSIPAPVSDGDPAPPA